MLSKHLPERTEETHKNFSYDSRYPAWNLRHVYLLRNARYATSAIVNQYHCISLCQTAKEVFGTYILFKKITVLHGVTHQNTIVFILIALRTWNLTMFTPNFSINFPFFMYFSNFKSPLQFWPCACVGILVSEIEFDLLNVSYVVQNVLSARDLH